MIQFDEHIFQMGWNHQLVLVGLWDLHIDLALDFKRWTNQLKDWPWGKKSNELGDDEQLEEKKDGKKLYPIQSHGTVFLHRFMKKISLLNRILGGGTWNVFYLHLENWGFMIQIWRACLLESTPPKFNIAAEKWWLEGYFPIGKVTFQGLCQTSGG